jgi:streptogramin lyase
MKTVEGVATNPASAVVDGDFVWVGDWSAPQVVRLHAIGPARPHSITLPPRSCCFEGVWNIAAGAGDIWATTPREDALWRIDPTTNGVTRVSFPYMPAGVTADANDVWVTMRQK